MEANLRFSGLAVVAFVLWLLFTRLVAWSDVAEAIADLDNGDWAWLIAISAIRVAMVTGRSKRLSVSERKARQVNYLAGFSHVLIH